MRLLEPLMNKRIFIFILFSLILCVRTFVWAKTLQIEWNPVTVSEKGQPLFLLGGYHVFEAHKSLLSCDAATCLDDPSVTVHTVIPNQTTILIEGVSETIPTYFRVNAFSLNGQESLLNENKKGEPEELVYDPLGSLIPPPTEIESLKFKNIFTPSVDQFMVIPCETGVAHVEIYARAQLVRRLSCEGGQARWEGDNEQQSPVASGAYVLIKKGHKDSQQETIVVIK